MPGPPKKPTNLKLLHGTFRADRANPKEAQPPLEIPAPPAHLSEVALEEWNRMSQVLFKLGLLTQLDRAALALYCSAYGFWVEAEQKIAEQGAIAVTTQGNAVQNPWFQVRNKAFDQMKKIVVEFGLTPASRSRVTAEPPTDGDDDGLLD